MATSHTKKRAPAVQKPTNSLRAETVTESRARAQHAKIAAQTRARSAPSVSAATSSHRKSGQKPRQPCEPPTHSIADAIETYLQDHRGGNHSAKTLEWHATALGLLRRYLEEEWSILLVSEVDAPAISAWFAALRKIPGKRGTLRCERTVQTYARSARAFFHWLVRQEAIERNPFDRIVFPKVGRPLIQTITDEEFERLLQACTPPNESGPLVERAVARNRAMLWLLYDTGIRV